MAKLKVLLINPPQTYYEKSSGFSVYFPIGLLSIAANIREQCEVKVLDCLVEEFTVTKKGTSYLYGMPWPKVEERIREYGPDIVGISAPSTAQYKNAARIAEICNGIDPDITTVMGGPDPSVRYRQILDEGVCDYCVIGEGEECCGLM